MRVWIELLVLAVIAVLFSWSGAPKTSSRATEPKKTDARDNGIRVRFLPDDDSPEEPGRR